jgi:hypothetical protein
LEPVAVVNVVDVAKDVFTTVVRSDETKSTFVVPAFDLAGFFAGAVLSSRIGRGAFALGAWLSAAAGHVFRAGLATAVIDTQGVVDGGAFWKGFAVRDGGTVAKDVFSSVGRFNETKAALFTPRDAGTGQFALRGSGGGGSGGVSGIGGSSSTVAGTRS